MGLQGTRVLLVEDEPLIVMLLEDMLSDMGCLIAAVASSVPEGLMLGKAGGFDVALLDVNLQGKEVFPLAELLSAQGVPYAFASGSGAAGLPQAFHDRPIVGKPFRIEELSATLLTALARRD